MKKLWNVINELKINKELKNKFYLVTLILINMMFGALLWVTLGRIILPKVEWFLCFVGYPAIFVGFLGGLLYLYNHEFA